MPILTDQDYAAIPAVNFSSLKPIAVSPMNYRWEVDHPEDKTSKQVFVFGGAFHCRLLEPNEFDNRYAVFENSEEVDDGEGGKRTKKKQRRGKAWDAWQADHPDRIALTPKEMDRAQLMVERIEKGVSPGHERARDLLKGGRREEVLRWTDAQTRLPCKGRLDYIRPDLFLDVKTMARAPKYGPVQRAIFEFGYQAQCAFYHDGAVAARRINGRKQPWIIAAQTTKPYDVACYELDEATLDHGRKVYRHWLQQLQACTAADYWPGVAPEPQLMSLPPWAETQGITAEDVEAF